MQAQMDEGPSSEDEVLVYSTMQDLPPANMIAVRPQIMSNEICAIYKRPFKETGIINTQKSFLEDECLPNVRCEQATSDTMTLMDYYERNQHNLIYKRYEDIDLGRQPEGQRFYFATINANLQKKQPKMMFRGDLLSETPSKFPQEGIVFDSYFESGNLFLAFATERANTYDLILQNDTNTRGNTQWFYFSVSGVAKGTKLTLRLINHVKTGSLFNNGLRPAVYSKKLFEQENRGWFRGGFDISYRRSQYRKEYPLDAKGRYYVLEFSYTVETEGDTIYFCHSYPYTYTDLLNFLNRKVTDNFASTIMTRKVLCTTVGGNKCEVITITSNSLIKRRTQRKGIVILGRQHPGEPQGSYVLEGLIDFLVSDDPVAENLRNNFFFKIIPMLNIDGVVVGNYRCGLEGNDLNRRWNNPNKKLHPSIYFTKKYIRGFAKERPIQFILDLHGHSRQLQGTFFYGCSYTSKMNSAERVLAFQLSKISRQFDFGSCTFRVEREKYKTARITLWRELKVSWVYTYECSFYGQDNRHYQIKDYKNCGKNILIALDMVTKDQFTVKQEEVTTIQKQLIEELKTLPEQEILDNAGSDSSPSEGELSDDEMLLLIDPKALIRRKANASKMSTDKEKPPLRSKDREASILLQKQRGRMKSKDQSGLEEHKKNGGLNLTPQTVKTRFNSLYLSSRKSQQQLPMVPVKSWDDLEKQSGDRVKTTPAMVDKCVQTDAWLYNQWLSQINKKKQQLRINQKQQLAQKAKQLMKGIHPDINVNIFGSQIMQQPKGKSLDRYFNFENEKI